MEVFRRVRIVRMVTLVAGITSVSACSSSPTSDTIGQDRMSVTQAQNGQTVTLTAQQSLVITLQAQTDGGYLWSLANAPDATVLKFISSASNPPPSGTAVGASGTSVWTFQAVGSGHTSVALNNVRPTVPTDIAGTFTLNVIVQ